MNIFTILFRFFLVLLSCSLFSCSHSINDESTPPNIIFIMTDDHAKSAISAYGSQLIQTSHIDRIAQNGILFKNAFVTNSICGPSRAVFLTGKFSHKNGFMSNRDTFNGDQATLPKYLQENGYYTAIMGKWHLKSKPQGFDEYSVLIGQGEYYNPRFTNGIDTNVVTGYSTTIITDKSLEVLKKQKEHGKPIFLMVHHKAPHRNWMPEGKHLQGGREHEYPLPKTFYDDYTTRSAAATRQDMRIEDMFLGYDLKLQLPNGQLDETGTGGGGENVPSYSWWQASYESLTPQQKQIWDDYYNPINQEYANKEFHDKELLEWKFQRYMNDYLKCIQSVDDNVGRILDYLEQNDMMENTLIIYTSDQGFYLGEHGWYDKRFMYEQSLTTPLVMQYPKQIKNRGAFGELVQNIDLAPTILTAANIPVPEDMQGVPLNSFFQLKEPLTSRTDWREKIYYHYYQQGVWHYVERHLGIRTDRYKLIYFYDIDAWELYDLKNDPEEVENLITESRYNPLVDSLKGELRTLIANYEDDTAVSF